MRQGARTIRWREHEFRFETFEGRDARSDRGAAWAVWWRGEFIGTMPADPKETTREFELRSIRWLADLLPPGRATP
jgi:hypothetical protein